MSFFFIFSLYEPVLHILALYLTSSIPEHSSSPYNLSLISVFPSNGPNVVEDKSVYLNSDPDHSIQAIYEKVFYRLVVDRGLHSIQALSKTPWNCWRSVIMIPEFWNGDCCVLLIVVCTERSLISVILLENPSLQFLT